MPLTATTTSQVLNGLMWKGPNSWFGKTGKTTAVRTRNLVKVRISTGATLVVRPSRNSFISSSSMLATLIVVAIQNCSR